MAYGNKNPQLPVVRSAAIALVAESGSAIVEAARPPKTVTRGAVEIMTAFPSPGATDGDRRIVLDLYHEAVAGFPRAVVEWTLKWLVFHNPRNTPTFTCPPTPQDVREACQVTHRCWELWVVDFYFEGKWAKPSASTMLKKDNSDLMNRLYAATKGGKPGDPECIVPLDLQIHYLRQEIERQLPHIENEEQRSAQQYADAPLLAISDEDLDRMPEAAFLDGALKLIRAKRAARAEAARKAAEHEAYINSLPDDVRYLRWSVVKSEQWVDADEADIMAETNRRLEIINAARAKAEADGGEFLGMTFDDGSEWRERDFQRFYRQSPRRA